MISPPILFLGPVRAGKTTVAKMVAERTGLLYVSLDVECWKYYREIGYDLDLAWS